MKPEERLFSAIGGADEALLERSGRTKARPRVGRYLAAAACLALMAGVWLWSASVTGYLPGGGRDLPAQSVPDAQEHAGFPEEASPPEDAAPQLERAGWFSLVRHLEGADGQPAMPAYSYCLDFDFGGGLTYPVGDRGEFFLRPLEKMPEDAPACQLDLLHLPGCTLEEAVETRRSYNEARYTTVTLLDENSADLLRPWPEGAAQVCLLSSCGSAWNDRQAEDWFFDDGQSGVFVLASHYFTEATEGWGTRFYNLVCSFRVEEEPASGWKADLEDAVLGLAEAAFAGELEAGSPLLTADAELYLEDLEAGEASVTAYACSVMTGGAGGFSGTAEAKFRTNGTDSPSVLVMLLSYEDGRWLASGVGLRGEDGANPWK